MKGKTILIVIMLAAVAIALKPDFHGSDDAPGIITSSEIRQEDNAHPEAQTSGAAEVSSAVLLPSGGLTGLGLKAMQNKEAGAPDSFDESISITLLRGSSCTTLSLRDYLIGVVAAEMPASFSAEALKAQAVASRSCTMYNLIGATERHAEADICADSSCCQAYADNDKLKAKWGSGYDKYYAIVQNAVAATDGQYIAYEGKLIYAPYHSSSYAATEDSGQIWSTTPYLISVSSPETTDDVPNFITTLSVDNEEFLSCLSGVYPELSDDSAVSIGTVSLSPSGRVDSIYVNDICVSGTQLRSVFSLRSTNLEIQQDEEHIVFTSYGWGHGVGMSQYGADSLAEDGLSYDEILKWYYTGIEILEYTKDTHA